MLTLKEYAKLQEKSPLEIAGIKIGKALHRKEYEAALELMFFKNISAADAGKRFKNVDPRELQKMYDNLSESNMTNEACWKNYKQIGMKKKNGKEVPNCVPEEAKEADLEEGWKINKNTYFMGKDVGPVHSHHSGYTIAKIGSKWIVSNPDDEKSGEFPSLAKAKSEVVDLTESVELDEADQYVVMNRKTGKAVTKPMNMQQALDAYDGRGGNAKGLAVVKTTDKRLKEEVELDEAKYDKFGDRKDGKTRASAFRAKELKHELRNEKPSKSSGKTKKAEEPKSKYTPKNRHQRDMFEGTDFKAGDTVIDTNTKMKGVVQHKGNKDEIYVKFGSINKAIKASELRLSEEVIEEVAATSVAGGGVDMNPTGYSKRDKRKRSDTDQMYRRNLGLKAIKEILKRKNQ